MFPIKRSKSSPARRQLLYIRRVLSTAHNAQKIKEPKPLIQSLSFAQL